MPHDPEAFADMVVMHTKAALAPVLADVKSLQTQVAGWESRWNDLLALRERVAVVESKAVTEPRLEPVAAPVVDLSPVLERVAAVEARLDVLGDLRDRVITVETKTAMAQEPVEALPTDLSPLNKRVDAVAAQLNVLGNEHGHFIDRLVTVENKAVVVPAVDLSLVFERVSAVEHKLDMKGAELQPLMVSVAEATKAIGDMRERIAVVETRQPVPGPAGKDGHDGADGIGFEDLAFVQTDERTALLRGTRGTQVKELGTLTFPVDIYRGVWVEGKTYDRGDGTTWAGSEWHCNETTTTKPGDGSKAWTLKVKRGRDGKDGRDAEGALPVVAVGRAG